MRKTLQILTAAFVLATAVGCAHNHKVEGPQPQAEIPAGIRVGIGGKEISEGERVIVYKSVCRKVYRNRAGHMNQCHNEKVGEALVLKVLDHDSAIVQPQNNLQMDSSMTVEKQ